MINKFTANDGFSRPYLSTCLKAKLVFRNMHRSWIKVYPIYLTMHISWIFYLADSHSQDSLFIIIIAYM